MKILTALLVGVYLGCAGSTFIRKIEREIAANEWLYDRTSCVGYVSVYPGIDYVLTQQGNGWARLEKISRAKGRGK